MIGPGNLRLVLRGEVPKGVHAVNIGGRYAYTGRFYSDSCNVKKGEYFLSNTEPR